MAGERAPAGELALITAAIVASLALTVVVGCSRGRLRLPPLAEVAATTTLVGACVAIAAVALAAAYAGAASLDALSTALIGLLPAVQAWLEMRPGLLAARRRMKERPSLVSPRVGLCYLRLAWAPATQPPGGGVMDLPSAEQPQVGRRRAVGTGGRHLAYIVCHAGTQWSCLWRDAAGRLPPEAGGWVNRGATYQGRPLWVRAPPNSIAVAHGGNGRSAADVEGWGGMPFGAVVAHCADEWHRTEAARWFFLIHCAAHLVAKPELVHLTSADEVITGLVLAAEVVMMGDLVIHTCLVPLAGALADLHVGRTMVGDQGRVVNTILQEVGLAADWGHVAETVARYGEYAPKEETSRGLRYGPLFFLLSVSSKMFTDHDETAPTGADLIKRLQDMGSEVVDHESARNLARAWLTGWGMDLGPDEASGDEV